MAKPPQPATLTPHPQAGLPAAPAEAPPTRPGVFTRIGTLLGVLLVALAYILPGLTGHDPWRPHEPQSFGIIFDMVTTGDLVVPTLAGEPALQQPPGYAITAAGMVRLFHDWLPTHDAARVATGLFLAMTLLFVGLMARRAWGPGLGGGAVLGLVGTLGLIQHGHSMGPDIALAAGMVMGCYGLLRARDSGAWTGLWLGTGAGLAFISKGLFGPGILALSALLLLLFSDWRNRNYPRALAVAVVCAAPWFLVWPAELYLRAPDLFEIWLTENGPAHYLATVPLGPPPQGEFWLRTLPWMTFPLLPLALWTLARRPGLAFRNAGVRVTLVVSLVGWVALLYSSAARDLGALPLLAPLAVIAAGGLRDLPGWLVALVYWVSLLVFAILAAALWGLWGYGLVTGRPPQWPLLGTVLPWDFHPSWDTNAVLLGLAATLAWVLAVKRLRPKRPGAVAAWPLGLTLAWGLAALLHLPWLDAARSDRRVFAELAAQLPAEVRCLATAAGETDLAKTNDWHRMGLGASERALLQYFTGIKAVPSASMGDVSCDWLVVEVSGEPTAGELDLGTGWGRVWETWHQAAGRDSLVLFRRTQDQIPAEALGTPPLLEGPESVPEGGLAPDGTNPLGAPADIVPTSEPPVDPQPAQESFHDA
jgi:4-amino-4-deoxy-L-arabinose transferase-like glycosyltransferase